MSYFDDRMAEITAERQAVAEAIASQYRSAAAAQQARVARRPKQPPRLTGYVYFLKSGNAVKIGFSTNPKDRLHSLRTGCSDKAFFAKIVPGNRATEAMYHKRYAQHRLRGEWFDLSGALARYLERCNQPVPIPERIAPERNEEFHL